MGLYADNQWLSPRKGSYCQGGLALKLAARSVCKGRKVATDYAYSTAPTPKRLGWGQQLSYAALHNLLHQGEHLVGHVAEGEVYPGAGGHYGAVV